MIPKDRLLASLDELKSRIRVMKPSDPRLGQHRMSLIQYCGQVLLSSKGNRYATKVTLGIGQMLTKVEDPAQMMQIVCDLEAKIADPRS